MRRAYVFAGCISRRRWDNHTLSRRCWEYHALSRQCWEFDGHSAHLEYGYSQHRRWKHHTLSTIRWEYDALSAVWSWYYDISSGYKKTMKTTTKRITIGNTDDRRLTTLVNSTSTVPPIDLPPKGDEFCHTSNILLVGCWCRCALWRLYFNSSVVVFLVCRAVSWSVGWLVGQSVSRLVGRLVG